MNTPFGPWATRIDTTGSHRLSAFWRRRMARLDNSANRHVVDGGI